MRILNGPFKRCLRSTPSLSRTKSFHIFTDFEKAKPDEDDGSVRFQDGRIQIEDMSFSPAHLRDHCRSPDSFHPVTHQRLLDVFSLPQDPHPISLHKTDHEVHITWSDNGHKSEYPISYLRAIAPSPQKEPKPTILKEKVLWQGPTPSESWSPATSYETLTTHRETLHAALESLDQKGVIFISDVPPTSTATESLSLLLSNNHPRRTHYGTFWEFTADLKHGDLAYSNHALSPHTDTSYFENPCGLQIFHLLEHSSGEGGATTLVDGFSCAKQLKDEDPRSFEVLTRVGTEAHAIGTEGYSFQTTAGGHPVFGTNADGQVTSVRWNNDDRSKFGNGWSVDQVDEWYKAARAWDAILKREENVATVKLGPGTTVVIDNQRVMHGRTAFTGYRKMCGAYIGKDEWRSLLNVLRREATQKHLSKRGLKEDVYGVDY